MKRERSMDVLFGLLLLALFAVLILMTLLSGAGAYRGIERNLQSHDDQRTAVSYLAAKVRHYDAVGGVQVVHFDGRDALALNERIDGEDYTTLVYGYNGKLMELFAQAGSDLPPESGSEILAIGDLALWQEGNLLRVVCTGTDGRESELSLCLRARQEALS